MDPTDGGSTRGAQTVWKPVLTGVLLAVVAASLPWTVPALVDRLGGESDVAQVVAEPSVGDTRPPFVIEPEVEIVAAEKEPEPPRPAAATGRPTRLVVPRLGVNAPVVGIGVVDGVLLPPADPQTLGWWAAGARPGALRGGALITGHTVHTGGGAFDDLETLRKGDRVVVRTASGTIGYDVSGVTIYRKGRLARDAERVFNQTGPGRLVLITCEDWNGSGYDSNAIVFAERIDA